MSVRISVSFLNSGNQNSMIQGVANSMVLQVSNTGDPVALTGGKPDKSSGVFSITLNFEQLYQNAPDAAAIQIAGAGFTATWVSAENIWALTLGEDTTWQSTFTFSVDGVIPDVVDLGTYRVTVVVINGGTAPQPYGESVAVQAAPTTELKDNLPVDFSFTLDSNTAPLKNWMFITKTPDDPVENTLMLNLANLTNQPLVSEDWGSNEPRFILSFVTGASPGYYAVTTIEDLQNMSVAAISGNDWQVSGPGDSLTWTLAPRTSNSAILAGGAIAQFRLDNLLTQLTAGPAMIYLQYIDIPDYNDGTLAVMIQKVYDRMSISYFTINQTTPYLVPDVGSTSGSLNWSTSGAVNVQLECVPPAPPLPNGSYGQVPTSTNSWPVSIQQNQTFVLTAYDPYTGAILSASVAATVSAPIQLRWMPVGAIAAWSGDASNPPDGWYVCDGQNGTPDLRNRFVLATVPGDGCYHTSGTDNHSHTIGISTPTATSSSDGLHSHPMPNWSTQIFDDSKQIDTVVSMTPYSSYSTSGNRAAHSHTVSPPGVSLTTQPAQGGTRPPWYALYYIMKAG